MSNSYYGDAVVSTGEYTDKQGQIKKRWSKIGAMFRDSENGNISIKLDVLPMPKADGCWIKVFKKEEQQPQQNQPTPQPQYQAPPVGQPVNQSAPVQAAPIQAGDVPAAGGVAQDDIPFAALGNFDQ
jgi:hypothetical protein